MSERIEMELLQDYPPDEERITKPNKQMKKEIDNILEGFHKGEYDLITVKIKLLDLFSISSSLPDFECRCKELNAVNRICQKCSGIVPIRL